MIPLYGLAKIKHRKSCKYDERNHLLHRFELRSGINGVADLVGRNCKAIFEKRDGPAYRDQNPQRYRRIFKLPIPRKRHEKPSRRRAIKRAIHTTSSFLDIPSSWRGDQNDAVHIPIIWRLANVVNVVSGIACLRLGHKPSWGHAWAGQKGLSNQQLWSLIRAAQVPAHARPGADSKRFIDYAHRD